MTEKKEKKKLYSIALSRGEIFVPSSPALRAVTSRAQIRIAGYSDVNTMID